MIEAKRYHEAKREEFDRKLKNTPYDDDFKAFLERATVRYYKELMGVDIDCKINDIGVGEIERK